MRNNKGQFIKGTRNSITTEFKKGVSVSPKTQFKKGMKPWNAGLKGVQTSTRKGKKLKPLLEETKRKISKSLRGHGCSKETRIKIGLKHKGKIISEELRKKISIAQKGTRQKEKNPNWKGGITTLNKLERVKFSDTMQKLVFERDNYTCQLCGIRGIDLHVDHIQSWAEYVEQRFNMANCRTLCMKCHYKITFGREMPKRIRTWGQNFQTFIERRITF